jgi:hypothetical protein
VFKSVRSENRQEETHLEIHGAGGKIILKPALKKEVHMA